MYFDCCQSPRQHHCQSRGGVWSFWPPHFLDLNLDGNKFSIYRKHTFTGQYAHFDSFVPWKHRTAWLRSLLSRVYKICSPSNLKQELNFIKRIASWNGFPKQVVSALIKRFKRHHETNNDADETTDSNQNTLWFEMPYIGQKGEQLLRELRKNQNCPFLFAAIQRQPTEILGLNSTTQINHCACTVIQTFYEFSVKV